jgi:hypothetical protein
MASARRGREIERKFLVPRVPDGLDRCEATDIGQGYVVVGEDGTEVRLREMAGGRWRRFFSRWPSVSGHNRSPPRRVSVPVRRSPI